MLAELEDVVDFHSSVGFIKGVDISSEVGTVSVPAEPCWHESGFFNDEVACD